MKTFTLYSRPTAFGPEFSGRPTGSETSQVGLTASLSCPADSLIGCNWGFTPPYYNGEAWADFIFKPNAGETYDLEKNLIRSENSLIGVLIRAFQHPLAFHH